MNKLEFITVGILRIFCGKALIGRQKALYHHHSRHWSGSMSSDITTLSADDRRCTFMFSASSLDLSISAFAKWLCPVGRRRSATSNGCSENLVPQAITVATSAGCKGFSCFSWDVGPEGRGGYCKLRRLRNWAGLRRGIRV
jgi:hypothetical protein